MKNKTIFLFANPEFDKRYQHGISRIYQIICNKYNQNIKIINLEFLKSYMPQKEYSQKLLIAGGDGTIHKVLNTIPDKALSGYIFGFIPTGTANEYVKSMNLPLNFEESVNLMALSNNFNLKNIGIINGHIKFLTGILYGLGAEVISSTPQKTKHFLGCAAFPITFFTLLFKLLKNQKSLIKTFKIDSKIFKTNYLLINNAHLSSKMLRKQDMDKIHDGLIPIIYIHSKIRILDILRLLIKERLHYKILFDDAINFEESNSITLEFIGHTKFLIDGEYYYLKHPLHIKKYSQEIAVISNNYNINS